MNELCPETNVFYESHPRDYYAQQMRGPGMRTRWFRQRQFITKELVGKYFKSGLVLDIGCGNCLWNDRHIPTVGLDICAPMLTYTKSTIDPFFPVKADMSEGLPFKTGSIDVVVITEFLEHLGNVERLIAEIKRVLKRGAVVICSVPMGGFPFFWKMLFTVRCAYIGWRYNDDYYRNQCGHKTDFTAARMRSVFGRFELVESRSLYFLTEFFVFKKESDGQG